VRRVGVGQKTFADIILDIQRRDRAAILAATRQSQAYPRELGQAIVSVWLATRVSQESSGYLVGLQGHAGLKANGPECDTAWEGREVASVGPVILDRGSGFDSFFCFFLFFCWG
jgi:hypothetical protein